MQNWIFDDTVHDVPSLAAASAEVGSRIEGSEEQETGSDAFAGSPQVDVPL